jgi:hypothetical protein
MALETTAGHGRGGFDFKRNSFAAQQGSFSG